MKLTIAAVGRLKAGPEHALFEHYRARFDTVGRALAIGPLLLVERPESRAQSTAQRCLEESRDLIQRTEAASARIVLDETGDTLDSQAFAGLIATERDAGARDVAFLIGGPDGHGDDARRAAHRVVSLGRMTLPHGLARIVLMEQLYRAATIIAGHPYHRA